MKNNLSVCAFIFSLVLAPIGLEAAQEFSFDRPDYLISMDFQNASLKDVLKIFSIQSGLNFIASEAVKDRTLTLYFDKVPIQEAMDKLFKANNLAYELDPDSNIFIVKDWGKPEIELETKVFYLKYASVSSSHILEEVQSNIGSTTTATGTTGTGTSTTSTTGGNRYAVATDIGITTAVKKLLSKDGSVIEDYRTNSLIVQDIPSRMPMIAKTITMLDISPPQVMIEVEMLDVSKSAIDKLGVKFGSTSAPDLFKLIFSGPTTTTLFPLKDLAGAKTVAKTFTPGSLTMSNSYTVLFDYLKSQTDTRYLARPRILTLNNETAEFKIETNETVSAESTATTVNTATTTGVDISRERTGVTLRVTPQINPETGEITMFIMPTVRDTSTSGLTTPGGRTIKDPEERVTKALVRMKDGETIILAGLIRHQKSETITKLPILGDIPLLGSFFRHRDKDRDTERELLVFITPHIVKDKKVELAKTKAAGIPKLPEREQDTLAVIDRRQAVNTSLDAYKPR